MCFGSGGACVQQRESGAVPSERPLPQDLRTGRGRGGRAVPGAAVPCGARGFAFFSLPFSSMMCQLSVVESKSATFPTERPRHLLDDSVLEPHSPARGHPLGALLANGLSRGRVGAGSPAPPKPRRYPTVGSEERR